MIIAREINQETRVRNALERRGIESRKDGRVGYPDRIVLLGFGCHVWIEHKSARGRLTKAQRRVFPKLEAKGEIIIYGRGLTADQIVDAVLANARHCCQRTKCEVENLLESARGTDQVRTRAARTRFAL